MQRNRRMGRKGEMYKDIWLEGKEREIESDGMEGGEGGTEG